MSVTEPLFVVDDGDGSFVPTEHARGPWDAAHQHGGAPAALVARATERQVGDDFTVTRLTLEMLQPIPLAPLVLFSELTRSGQRVRGVAVTLAAQDTPVVRAYGIAIRHADLPIDVDEANDAGAGTGVTLAPGPDYGSPPTPFGVADGQPAFHRTGVEVRLVGGGFDQPGPARAWLRFRRPVVVGERPTGLQRAAAAADFGNGLSSVVPFDRWSYINADLTLHLARRPEGEWIGLDAQTVVSDGGTAMAESAVYDRLGRVGQAAQSLILDQRDRSAAGP